MGWSGMVTFMFMFRWWCYVDHGVGWDVNVHVTLKLFHDWSGFWEVNKNRRARLHAQLHWEVHANSQKKTTRRLERRRSHIVIYYIVSWDVHVFLPWPTAMLENLLLSWQSHNGAAQGCEKRFRSARKVDGPELFCLARESWGIITKVICRYMFMGYLQRKCN